MQQKITVLLTGATGAIGGAIAQLFLSKGIELYLLVRNSEKAKEVFGKFPNTHIIKCNLENDIDTKACIETIAAQGITFDFVVLAAGGAPQDKETGLYLFEDDQFPGETFEEKQKNAIETLHRINVLTKETIVGALEECFGEKLQQTVLGIMSSKAADFGPDAPERVNQEGYVLAQIGAEKLGEKARKTGLYKRVIVFKPGLVISALTKGAPLLSRLLEDEKNPRKTPEEYAPEVIKEIGLLI